MKTSIRASIRWQYLTAFVVLGIALVLAIVFRSWLVINLINPLTMLLWAILRVFLSVHQSLYWAALIFLAFFLGLRIIPQKPVVYRRYPNKEGQEAVDRVEYWYQLIRSAPTDAGKDQVLHTELQALMVEWQQAAGKRADAQPGPMPISVFALRRAAREIGNNQPWRQKLWSYGALARWIPWQINHANQCEAAIEQVVGFLETNMEMNIDEQFDDTDHR